MPKSIPQSITRSAFLDAYWHRTSLAAFCRQKGLQTSGSKIELAQRISNHLASVPTRNIKSKQRRKMPTAFSLDMIMGPNWHCSQALRIFFQSQTATKFTFNKSMRDFIADGAGKTLADALQNWHDTKDDRTENIEPQFEYNRFIRAYHEQNKDANFATAIAAWKIHRDTPKSLRN